MSTSELKTIVKTLDRLCTEANTKAESYEIESTANSFHNGKAEAFERALYAVIGANQELEDYLMSITAR